MLRVLNNFSDDPEIFGTLVAELRNFVQQDHHRVQIVEQRVKEVEAGRAKTISAKQTVERLVNQKASGLRLPPEIGHFISDTWSRVLVYLCVRHGDEGAEWTDAVQTFDDLLWSVQPLDAARRHRRTRSRPTALVRPSRTRHGDARSQRPGDRRDARPPCATASPTFRLRIARSSKTIVRTRKRPNCR